MTQPEMNPEISYDLNLLADYHQIFIRDAEAEEDTPDEWGKQLVEDMIAVDAGIIGIGTARNTRVPVRIRLVNAQPEDNFTEWDYVAEASIDVSSGQLIIAGLSDYLPDALHITVVPRTYRVRVYYSGLDTISEDGLKGNDRYQIFLWPEEENPPKVLKRPIS